MPRRRKGPFSFLVALLLAAGAGHAGAAVVANCGAAGSDFDAGCSLAELVGGGTIQVEDKLFSNWITIINTGFQGGTPADLAGIAVVGLDDDPRSPGLRFVSNGQWSLDVDDFTAQYLGIFRYQVSVVDSPELIAGHSLSLIPGAITSPAIVAANLLSCPAAFCSPSDILTTFSEALDGSEQLFDQENFLDGEFPFAPDAAISSDLTVRVLAGQTGSTEAGSAAIEAIEVRYFQVPEPASLALVGVALAGFGLGRRGRNLRPC